MNTDDRWRRTLVFRGLKSGVRARKSYRALRSAFRSRYPIETPVDEYPSSHDVAMNQLMLDRLRSWVVENSVEISGLDVAEVGPGNSRTLSMYMLQAGAQSVTLIERERNDNPAHANRVLSSVGLEPMSTHDDRITQVDGLIENFAGRNEYDFVYSNNVLEHVEVLAEMFKSTFNSIRDDGRCLHVVDLGGHGLFEDPIPPLQFQRYPSWLYWLMFPPGHRATRRLVSDYVSAAEEAGFVDVEVTPLRTVEHAYVEQVRPTLHRRIRSAPAEELAVIEFHLVGRKKSRGSRSPDQS